MATLAQETGRETEDRPDAALLDRIRTLIARGEIGSQSRLPRARDLAASLGAEPEAVREALAALEADGALWRDADEDAAAEAERGLHPCYDPMHIVEARLSIETTLAALCAQRATSDEVEGLRALLARAEEDPENDTWDLSLHRTIASHARSSALQAAFSVVDEARVSPSWQVALRRARTPAHREIYRRQHMAIVDAVCARDPAGAEAAMAEHLDTIKRHMAMAIGPR